MKKILNLLAVGAMLLAAACAKPNDSTPIQGKQDVVIDLVDVTAVRNLTPEFIGLSEIESGERYAAGDEITLTITPGTVIGEKFSDYHAEHIHVHVGDQVYMPVFKEAYSLSVTITIPDEDFEVVACYSVQQHVVDGGHTMTLEDNADVKLYGVSPDALYDYFDCYLLVTDAYTVNSVEYNMGAGWKDLSQTTGCSYSRTDVPNVYKVTVRPDYQNVTADVTLRVKGTPHARYKISWVNADDTHIDLSKFSFPTESIDGEQVVAEVWTKEPFYLDGASASVDVPSLETIARAYVRFNMPASDVAITLNFKEKIPVSVSETAISPTWPSTMPLTSTTAYLPIGASPGKRFTFLPMQSRASYPARHRPEAPPSLSNYTETGLTAIPIIPRLISPKALHPLP